MNPNFIVVMVTLGNLLPQSIAAKELTWGPWSACSVSCGGGVRSRIGSCTHSQNKCFPNDRNQTQECNTDNCTAIPPQSTTAIPTTLQTQNNSANTSSQSTLKQANTMEITTKEPITFLTKEIHKETASNPMTLPKETQKVPVQAKHTYQGEMKMQKTFTKELENSDSEEFATLKKMCEDSIQKTLDEGSIDATFVFLKFTSGSVVLHYRINSQEKISKSRLHDTLSTSIESGPMKVLSITTFTLTDSSNRLPDESGENLNTSNNAEIVKPWMYFLYGFGGMVGLAVLFVLLGITKNKVRPSQPEPNNDEFYDSYFNTPVVDKKMSAGNNKPEHENGHVNSAADKTPFENHKNNFPQPKDSW